MNIIVTGAHGQLGRSINDISCHFLQYNFTFTDIDTLDISDYRAVELFFLEQQPDIIINCAAYTAVDKAETEPQQAMSINANVVDNLAKLACKNNIFFIHISTDYVFDGKGYKPYKEDDTTNPISVYGKTKLSGEQAMQKQGCRGAIIRTSWLYSEYGNNFVKTMMRLGTERKQLNVVNDQIGSPTYAGDLAKAIMEIVNKQKQIEQIEIYHFSNEGVASWYDFAKEIIQLHGCTCEVLPIPSDQYPTPAQRPFYSILDKQKIKSHFSINIPHWKESLEKCMKRMI